MSSFGIEMEPWMTWALVGLSYLSTNVAWEGRLVMGSEMLSLKISPKQCSISMFTIIRLRFFNTIFVSSHMYQENPEETQVIVGSLNMGYISDSARNRTHNLFRPKREPIPLGHSNGLPIVVQFQTTIIISWFNNISTSTLGSNIHPMSFLLLFQIF